MINALIAWFRDHRRMAVIVAAVLVSLLLLGGAARDGGLFGPTVAAWVQGLGSVWAIVWAIDIASRQSREALDREQREIERRTADRAREIHLRRIRAVAVLEGAIYRLRTVRDIVRGGTRDSVTWGGVLEVLRGVVREVETMPIDELDDERAWHPFNFLQMTAVAAMGRLTVFANHPTMISSEAMEEFTTREAASLERLIQTMGTYSRDVRARWNLVERDADRDFPDPTAGV